MVKDIQMTELRKPVFGKQGAVPIKDIVVGIKGAGEMASGIACRLFNANIKYIFMMDVECPLAVRRKVSFCEAVYDGSMQVEQITAKRAVDKHSIPFIWQDNQIPVIIDPSWQSIRAIQPHVVIDAIIAKKNIGTSMDEAPLVIGLGPGFDAGKDCHIVIETNRGHDLGRLILDGPAQPNTGVPGTIGGVSAKRVLRAPCDGMFSTDLMIGTQVKKNDIVAHVDETPVFARIDGIIRGLIRPGTAVHKGLKIGDIDPRGEERFCPTVSEKARSIGGAVLEAILRTYNR